MLRQECKRVAAVSATPKKFAALEVAVMALTRNCARGDPALSEFPPPLFAHVTERARACAFVLSSTARYKRGQHVPIPRNESGEGVWS